MIYADSGVIMRWVEGISEVRRPIEMRWRQIPPSSRRFVTSRLSRLECRCRPLKNRQERLLGQYEIFFSGQEVDVRDVDVAVVEKATELRASFGLKTPDAIHAATAILADVEMFWTTDADFTKCLGLPVEVFRAV
ncbi:MAG: type II toxin-antitoxin system VapC family toxin [Thermoguttaceae bacterium]